MEQLIKTIEKNRTLLIIAVAVLMFIFFGFFSAVDIAGKAQANGMKVLFQGKGLGFSRFLSALLLIVPLLIVAARLVDFKLPDKVKENFDALCFVAGAVLCLIFAAALPTGIKLAWGSWIYIVLSIAGAAICRMDLLGQSHE